MRKIFACLTLFLIASLLLAPTVLYAQGPDIPPTPKDPGGILGFLADLEQTIRAFVTGLLDSLGV